MGALIELGVEIIRVNGDEALGKCPAHIRRVGREDRHPSWSVNTESGMHNCLSCGFKGPFISLVKEMTGRGDDEASLWINSHRSSKHLRSRRYHDGALEDPVAEIETYTEADLALFDPVPGRMCSDRDLDPAACDFYGVLWDKSRGNWITPVRDIEGRLLGYQEKSHKRRYFRNRPQGLEKGKTLFGAYLHDGSDLGVLVESPLDVPKVYEALDGRAVGLSTFGATITDEQIYMLYDMGIRYLVSALDNDKAGDKANIDLIRRWRGRRLYFWDYSNSDAKDPGDQTVAQARWSFENRYSSLRWRPAWL